MTSASALLHSSGSLSEVALGSVGVQKTEDKVGKVKDFGTATVSVRRRYLLFERSIGQTRQDPKMTLYTCT